MPEISQAALLKIASNKTGGALFGLSVWGLVAGTVFSVVGYFYFRAGKRGNNFTTLGTGIALMAFPYFVTQTLYIVIIGAGIIILHYVSNNYQ